MISTDANGLNTVGGKKLKKEFFKALSEVMPKFEKFLSFKESTQYTGSTFSVATVGDLSTASIAPLAENGTITALTPAISQVSVTLAQYAYKVIFSEFLVRTAELDFEKMVRSVLARHCFEVQEKLAHDLVYDPTNLVAVPSTADSTILAITTNGTAANSLPAGVQLSLQHLEQLIDDASTKRIPKSEVSGYVGKYICLGPQKKLRQLRRDLQAVQKENNFSAAISSGDQIYEDCVITAQNLIENGNIYFFGGEVGYKVINMHEQFDYIESEQAKTQLGMAWKLIAGWSPITTNRIYKVITA